MNDLNSRSKRMIRTGDTFKLTGTDRSVQFLRGVFSRSTMCIPAFYYFLGSASAFEIAKDSDDHLLKVAQTYSDFSNLNTLTLACRKMFDHATKPDLTGANFAKLSDSVLENHAEYWSKSSGENTNDCFQALTFLRSIFSEYSKTDTVLLKTEGTLHKRIGLLKQHADRSAAHLSLQDYALDIHDLAHFTAAVVVVGEIIRSFDNHALGHNYFNQVEQASYKIARSVFPQIPKFQLFGNIQIQKQASFYWKHQDLMSIKSIFDELQFALGGFRE